MISTLYQGAGKRPRQCSHSKYGNGADVMKTSETSVRADFDGRALPQNEGQ